MTKTDVVLCRFAVAVAKCLGGSLFWDTVYMCVEWDVKLYSIHPAVNVSVSRKILNAKTLWSRACICGALCTSHPSSFRPNCTSISSISSTSDISRPISVQPARLQNFFPDGPWASPYNERKNLAPTPENLAKMGFKFLGVEQFQLPGGNIVGVV